VATDRERWVQPRSTPRNGRPRRDGASSAHPLPDRELDAWPSRGAEVRARPNGRPAGAGPAAWPEPEGEAAGWAPLRGGRTETGSGTARGSTRNPAGRSAAGPATAGGPSARSAKASAAGASVAGPKQANGATDDPEGKSKRKGMPLWQELPLLIVVAFCLAVLIRTFLLQAFYIPSGSMEDTLLIGDRVLVNKVVYDVRDPKRGEVVVFRGPANWVPEAPTNGKDDGFLAGLARTVGDLVGISTPGEKDFIKRVIGLPGDTVACCDDKGRVTVNGTPLDEPYVIENSPLDAPPAADECRSRKFGPVKVEEGQLFVMGDHRLVSQDSRCQGLVPIDNVIGRAFVIVWPNSRWDRLPVPDTFAHVAEPTAAGRPGVARLSTPDAPGVVTVLLPFVFSRYISARSRRSVSGRRRRLAP